MTGLLGVATLSLAVETASATPCALTSLRDAVATRWAATDAQLDAAAEAGRKSAAGVDAPDLRVGVDNLDADATPPGAAFVLTVPIPAPWIEVAQRGVADAEDAERRAVVAGLVAASVGEVTERYGERLAAQTRREAAESARDAARALAAQQQRAAAGGWISAAEALRALEAVSHWQQRLDEAVADVAAADAALLAWVPDLDTTRCVPVASPPLDPPAWTGSEADARAVVLEARARVARAEGLPWIDAVRATMTARDGARPDGGVGVVVRLPWPTGAQAESAAWRNEAALARTAEIERQKAADARYVAAATRWRSADNALADRVQATPAAPVPTGDPAADADARLAWAGLMWWRAEAEARAIEAAAEVWALRPP